VYKRQGSNRALLIGFLLKIQFTWLQTQQAKAGDACCWRSCAKPQKRLGYAN
jgi:hypothetical protein